MPQRILCHWGIKLRLVITMIAFALIGCGYPDPNVESISLLNPYALTPVDAEADPLVQHRPFEIDCPPATWGPEGGGLRFKPAHVTMLHLIGLSTEVKAGALNIVVWHDTLDYPEPVIAHVAVWIGKTVLWEATVGIPAPSDSFEVQVPIEVTPENNDRLGLHLTSRI